MHKHVPPAAADEDSVDPTRGRRSQNPGTAGGQLRSAGYETQSVQSGARASKLLLVEDWSARSWLDLLMPGMDGFEVVGFHTTAKATLRELPIFVMTGKTLDSTGNRDPWEGHPGILSEKQSLATTTDCLKLIGSSRVKRLEPPDNHNEENLCRDDNVVDPQEVSCPAWTNA